MGMRESPRPFSRPRRAAARRAGRALPRRLRRRRETSRMPSRSSIFSSTSTSVRPAGCEIRRRRSRSCSSGASASQSSLKGAQLSSLSAWSAAIASGSTPASQSAMPHAMPVRSRPPAQWISGRRLGVPERRQRLRELAAIAIGEREVGLLHRRPLPRDRHGPRIHRLAHDRHGQRLERDASARARLTTSETP